MKIASIKRHDSFDTVNIILLCVILVLILYPLIYIISCSFSDPAEILRGNIWFLPKKFSLSAYQKVLFGKNDIMRGYLNTIMYTVAGTLINVAMTVMIAYPLSRKNLYGKTFFTFFITLTMFFTGGLIPTYLVVKSLHLINNFWVMILPSAVSVWNIIIMRTFFKSSIPEGIYEAALIDGASNIKILIRIVLPLSQAVLAVMFLYYGVAHWNSFFDALIYLNDQDKYPLQLILRTILLQNAFQTMTTEGNAAQQLVGESMKYAAIVVSSLPLLIIYPFLQKYFVQGMMVGAIKG